MSNDLCEKEQNKISFVTVPTICLKGVNSLQHRGKKTQRRPVVFELRRQNLEFEKIWVSIICGLSTREDRAAHIEKENSEGF